MKRIAVVVICSALAIGLGCSKEQSPPAQSPATSTSQTSQAPPAQTPAQATPAATAPAKGGETKAAPATKTSPSQPAAASSPAPTQQAAATPPGQPPAATPAQPAQPATPAAAPQAKPANNPPPKAATPPASSGKAPPDIAILRGNPMGAVKFNHAAHARDRGIVCSTCHHPSRPEKPASAPQQACSDCHTKTATPPMRTKYQNAFHSSNFAGPLPASGLCVDCHKAQNAQGKHAPARCTDCHKKENG